MTEFRDKARPAELGDPATDRPMTLRVHPDDDPRDPRARRVIKTNDGDCWPWAVVTDTCRTDSNPPLGHVFGDDEVADWPYTSHPLASAAFRDEDEHRTFTYNGIAVICLCGSNVLAHSRTEAGEWWREHRRQALGTAAQAAERGDLTEASFKGGVDG